MTTAVSGTTPVDLCRLDSDDDGLIQMADRRPILSDSALLADFNTPTTINKLPPPPSHHASAAGSNYLIDSLDPFSAASVASKTLRHPPPNQQHKAFSCSEYEEKLFSAEDLIRANSLSGSKSRSHSEPEDESSLRGELQNPASRASVFASEFGPFAVPPPVSRKSSRPSTTSAVDKSPSPARYTDVQLTALKIDPKRASQTSLNGFIRHENVGALIAGGGEKSADSSTSQREGTALVIKDDDGDSSSSDDEVFSRYAKGKSRGGGSSGNDRKPLIKDSSSANGGGGGKRRVHFAKGKERVRLSLNDLDDDYGPKIRRGRSWRSRLSCVVYCLAANLLGVALAFLLYYEVRGGGRGAGDAASAAAVCPRLGVTYMGNRSTEDESIGPLDGHSKLIKSSAGFLFLIPYGFDCYDCENGIAALRANKLELAWVAAVDGKIEEFACGEDLNEDGVWDCAISTVDPFSIELISGEDGSSIGRLLDEDNGRRIFLPQWIPDSNSDGIPELIATVYDKRARTVIFLLFSSRRRKTDDDSGGRPAAVADRGRVDAAPYDDDVIGDRRGDVIGDRRVDVIGDRRGDFTGGRRRGGRYRRVRAASTSKKTVDFVIETQLLRVTNASTQQEALLWKTGDSSKHSVVAVFDSKPGLYLWRKYDFLKKDYAKVRTIASTYRFDAPMGIFLDSDGDGDPELIACTKNGTVLSVGIGGDVRWTYHRPAAKCISTSMVGGRFMLESAPGVVVSFKSTGDDASIQTILLDGEKGRFERVIVNSSGAFDASPIVGRLFGDSSQDRLLTWTLGKQGQIKYIATGFPWYNTTVYDTAFVKTNTDFVTDKEELLRIHAFNQRFTGAVYEDKGSLMAVFATNNKDATVTVHKTKLTCECDQDKEHCGKFAERQYWPSYRGSRGDGYLQ